MPRGLHNWTFRNVKKFLTKNGFKIIHVLGSHYYFFKKENCIEFMPQVPFHTSKSIYPKTMETIIRKSGIPRKEWK